jgi:ABC-type methionine transport system ATPase subunit
MAKRMVTLIFPETLVREPVIYRLSRRFKIIPNVRRARVTEKAGELTLELEGEEEELAKGIAYLNGLGIRVEPVAGARG